MTLTQAVAYLHKRKAEAERELDAKLYMGDPLFKTIVNDFADRIVISANEATSDGEFIVELQMIIHQAIQTGIMFGKVMALPGETKLDPMDIKAEGVILQ